MLTYTHDWAHISNICVRVSSKLAEPDTDQPSPLRPVRFVGGLPLVKSAVQHIYKGLINSVVLRYTSGMLI